jgi:hypothetical protein
LRLAVDLKGEREWKKASFEVISLREVFLVNSPAFMPSMPLDVEQLNFSKNN